MDMHADDPLDQPHLRLVQPGESVQVIAQASDADVLVTDRRIIVRSGDRVTLDLAFDGLRRIQFDIEKDRPATLVIVPENPAYEPQVLAIPHGRYEDITTALALVGNRIAGMR